MISSPFRSTRSKLLLGILSILSALAPGQMRADTVALTVFPRAILFNAQDQTVGWSFSLANAVSVTQLGLYDYALDGLGSSLPVTIWTSTGTAVALATVPAGAGAPLTDGFRYVTLASPVSLAPGDYVIGAYYPTNSSDYSLEAVVSLTSAPGVTYTGSRASFGDTFPPGDQNGVSFEAYFGPNFQFTSSNSVPDTGSTWLLLGGALTALAGLKSCRPRRA